MTSNPEEDDFETEHIPQHAEPSTVEPQPGTDAAKRAWRTLFQNLALDVLVAVVLLLAPVVSSAQSFADFDWPILLFSIVKTVVVTALSFVTRYFKIAPSTL